MNTQTPAYVRTNAPIAAGPIIVFIAKQLGWDVSVEEALVIVPLVSSAYYTLGRVLESLNPKFGYILGVAKTPAYSTAPAPSPSEGEKVEAVVVPDDAPVAGDGFLGEAYEPGADEEQPPV